MKRIVILFTLGVFLTISCAEIEQKSQVSKVCKT